MTDRRTIGWNPDVDEEDIPDDIAFKPLPEPVPLGEAEVMGGIVVNNTDKKGGVWNLKLEVQQAVKVYTATEVDERLEEGTYVLVRLNDG